MPKELRQHSHSDPIYYNLTLNKGFSANDNSGFNTPSFFSEINSRSILNNSGDWFISLMRCTIPTSVIPRYIFPIQIGEAQTNENLSYNTFTFKYSTAPNVYMTIPLANCQLTVPYETELLNPYPNTGNPTYFPTVPEFSVPKPPSANGGNQDLTGQYYFVYNVMTLVSMFNNTLSTLWTTFKAYVNANGGVIDPTVTAPYYTYDNVSMLWSFHAESTTFGQDHYPRVELYCDNLTTYNTFCPTKLSCQDFVPNKNTPIYAIIRVENLYNNTSNVTVGAATQIWYTMTAEQSAVVSYSGFQKIIFEISGDILLVNNETDAIPLNFQGSTTAGDFSKPSISMLVDIEVDRDQWAVNNNFIQFQASAIEQVRLISLAQKSTIQNFGLNIYWLDSYGNRRPLEIPSIGNPLTIKLAFFNKDFRNVD